MTLPQQKERSHKFKLALRMGLPIFFLSVLLFGSFIGEISSSLITTSISLLLIGIYFIFYLIDENDNNRIVDPITKTFDKYYILKLFSKKIKDKNYSIALIRIDNLDDINEYYGLTKGDKILFLVSNFIQDFFKENIDEDIAISHFKGADFLIGIEHNYEESNALLQLLNIKLKSNTFNDIEIVTSVSIVESSISKNVNQIIQRLYEIINYNSQSQNYQQNQSELELSIIDAIEQERVSLMAQKIDADIEFYECSIKLLTKENSIIHQKQFLPIINRLDLAKKFYLIYINKLCDCKKNDALYAVKIDPLILRDNSFFNEVKIIMNSSEKSLNSLVIIFSEKEYYFNIKKFNNIINAYKKLGILFAVDDIGYYQTSTLYARDLNIDILRLNVQYSKNLFNDKYIAIIKGYIEIAQALGIKSWVKFIENENDYKIAKDLNFDYIQGKFIDKGEIL